MSAKLFSVIQDGYETKVIDAEGRTLDSNDWFDQHTVEFLIDDLYRAYGPFSYVYIIRRWGQHKIGISDDPKRRIKELGGWGAQVIRCQRRNVRLFERQLHRAFAHWATHNEHFNFKKEVAKFEELVKSLQTEADLRRWLDCYDLAIAISNKKQLAQPSALDIRLADYGRLLDEFYPKNGTG